MSQPSNVGHSARPNQHHEDVTPESMKDALLRFLDQWQRAGCDCCSPTISDEAFDLIELTPEIAEQMRRVGIELANTGQWIADGLVVAGQKDPSGSESR